MLSDLMAPFDGKLEKYGQQTFAQFGEDVILFAWLDTLRINRPGGFFVDLGAHHPRFSSNTYLLRKLLGWRGMNVEADPALFKVFEKECPECVNVNVAVGGTARKERLTVYNHPGANTMSDMMRERHMANAAVEIRDVIDLDVIAVNDLLNEHLPKDVEFRVLSVDVEGLDQEIIEAFDFTRWRPILILVEDFEMDLRDPNTSGIYRRMSEARYLPVAHCMVTTLYRTLI